MGRSRPGLETFTGNVYRYGLGCQEHGAQKRPGNRQERAQPQERRNREEGRGRKNSATARGAEPQKQRDRKRNATAKTTRNCEYGATARTAARHTAPEATADQMATMRRRRGEIRADAASRRPHAVLAVAPFSRLRCFCGRAVLAAAQFSRLRCSASALFAAAPFCFRPLCGCAVLPPPSRRRVAARRLNSAQRLSLRYFSSPRAPKPGCPALRAEHPGRWQSG